jgi:hypothetical protein
VDKIYDVFAEYGTATALANTNKLSVSRWTTTGTGGNSARLAAYDAGTTYAIGDRVTYGAHDWVKISTAAAGTTPVAGAAWTDNGTSVVGDFAGLYQHEGVWVQANSAAGKKRRWLGIIYTYNNSATVNFKDDVNNRYVSNFYNRKIKDLASWNTTTSWVYATAAWGEWNGGTGQIKGNFVQCENSINLLVISGFSITGAGAIYVGGSFNSTTGGLPQVGFVPSIAVGCSAASSSLITVPCGFNYFTLTHYASASSTFYSSSGVFGVGTMVLQQ